LPISYDFEAITPPLRAERQGTISKNGNRFSEKILLKQQAKATEST